MPAESFDVRHQRALTRTGTEDPLPDYFDYSNFLIAYCRGVACGAGCRPSGQAARSSVAFTASCSMAGPVASEAYSSTVICSTLIAGRNHFALLQTYF